MVQRLLKEGIVTEREASLRDALLEKSCVVNPGEPLPNGVYADGWKLADGSLYLLIRQLPCDASSSAAVTGEDQ